MASLCGCDIRKHEDHDPYCLLADLDPKELERLEEEIDAMRLEEDDRSGSSLLSSHSLGNWGGTMAWAREKQCTHALDPYLLQNGTTLLASAFHDEKLREFEPDESIYLDGCWFPAYNVATFLPWPDMRLPLLDHASIVKLARRITKAAALGDDIEIGCIGSHGRTGTFLAICELVTMSNPNPKVAIQRVRAGHCTKAIETDKQERYIRTIANFLKKEKK